MLDTVAHVGVEHPDLLWIAVPALLAFAAGLAVAMLAGQRDSQPEAVSEPEEQ